MSIQRLVQCFCGLLMCVISNTAAAGNVDTLYVHSSCMHKETPCIVITPDDYADTTKTWPVLYLLHGYGGDYTSWLSLDPALPQKADLLNMVIVCPDGGYRSWYLDSPVDTTFRYETYMIQELVPFIDAHYRTAAGRGNRAITGLSMGGHGGLFLGIRHSDLFGAAGSTSGGVDIRLYTASWDLKEMILGDTICCKKNWEDFTVINVVDQLRDGQIKLIIDCGTEDFFIGVNRNLHTKLLRMSVDHDYIERPGGHDSAYWKNSIDYQLLFFRKFFDSSTLVARKVHKD